MRISEIISIDEGIDPRVRFPRPSKLIYYSDEQEPAPIFIRPSAGTVLKCIDHDSRALIYEDGTLVVWYQGDMYHRDVYDDLKRGEPLLLMIFPPEKFKACVAVKSDTNIEKPFTDEKWLDILHSSVLAEIYGEEFEVIEDNWW